MFEKVNTGGVSLTVFELMTATFAADDYNLRQDWEVRQKKLKDFKVLKEIQSGKLLQAIALLATSARREAKIDAGVTLNNTAGIAASAKISFLSPWPSTAGGRTPSRKALSAWPSCCAARNCSTHDLSYGTQLTPLAAIMAMLGDRAENDGVRSRLVRWYWCGVFGELYGSSVESRFARDLPEVLAWLDGGARADHDP